MTDTQRTFTIRRAWRWTLRACGLALVFVFTAAPLPGDSPGCDNPGGVDDSPALLGDRPVRSLCGEHCWNDCETLVDCGRFTPGAGYTDCGTACTSPAGRNCAALTFDSFCPIDVYGPDRVITQAEYDKCLDDALTAGCWCDPGANCWDPAMPMPLSCTAVALCDAR